jgi:hypothetical protein
MLAAGKLALALQNFCSTYAKYIAIHTAQPSSGNEVTGGSPAYARIAPTWTISGTVANPSATLTFNIPSGVTISHVGVWDTATGGVLQAWAALPTSTYFNTQGTYNLVSLVISLT